MADATQSFLKKEKKKTLEKRSVTTHSLFPDKFPASFEEAF